MDDREEWRERVREWHDDDGNELNLFKEIAIGFNHALRMTSKSAIFSDDLLV